MTIYANVKLQTLIVACLFMLGHTLAKQRTRALLAEIHLKFRKLLSFHTINIAGPVLNNEEKNLYSTLSLKVT